MKKNMLVERKNIVKEIENEIKEEYKNRTRELIKKKIIQIRKTERILELQKKDLNDLMTGKKKITEDNILFDCE
jgi:hypothetical protein